MEMIKFVIPRDGGNCGVLYDDETWINLCPIDDPNVFENGKSILDLVEEARVLGVLEDERNNVYSYLDITRLCNDEDFIKALKCCFKPFGSLVDIEVDKLYHLIKQYKKQAEDSWIVVGEIVKMVMEQDNDPTMVCFWAGIVKFVTPTSKTNIAVWNDRIIIQFPELSYYRAKVIKNACKEAGLVCQ